MQLALLDQEEAFAQGYKPSPPPAEAQLLPLKT
jgi:hypothetical protein